MKRYSVTYERPALAEHYGVERYVIERRYWTYKSALRFVNNITAKKKSYTQLRLIELRVKE